MEQVKKPTLLSVLFGNNFSSNLELEEIKDEELKKAMATADKMGKEVEEAVHSDNKSSKNGGKSGGLNKKIKTPTFDMSQNKIEEMKQKLEKGREERE